MKIGFHFLIALITVETTMAVLHVPAVFSDHMVLQRDTPLPVWGWADPGATVTVRFDPTELTTTASSDGRWEVLLPKQNASNKPKTLIIQSSTREQLVIRDVLVGDVWILGGQSNMGWSVKQSSEADAASRADHAWLRAFQQAPYEGATDQPAKNVTGGKWVRCTPTTAPHFSAVGFFFAEALHSRLEDKVPVALVHTAMGGTAIESWIDLPALESNAAGNVGADFFRKAVASYQAKHAQWLEEKHAWQTKADQAEAKGLPQPGLPPHLEKEPDGVKPYMLPAALFNGKIAPLQPFASRGVIWYQGEGNAADTAAANRYGELLPLMIKRWRLGWRNPTLPFIVVQLPGYESPSRWADWPTLRAHQAATVEKTPHTALVVTLDLGTEHDIHPVRKQPVGERAALAALKMVDRRPNIIAEGPRFLEATREAGQVRLRFQHTDDLITSNKEAPQGLELAGADGIYSPVPARIEKDMLVVDSVPAGPVTFRYAWKNWPLENIRDGSGLPLAPFRTPPLP